MPRFNLPSVIITMSVSDGMAQLTRDRRRWNQYGRHAMEVVLIHHHKNRIPKHFEKGAAAEYGYPRRSLGYRKKKLRYYRVDPDRDLVKTGALRQSITQSYWITYQGAFGGPTGAEDGSLRGRLNMRSVKFLYPAKSGVIGPEEIAREITETVLRERREIAEQFRDLIVTQINAYSGPRRRAQYGN